MQRIERQEDVHARLLCVDEVERIVDRTGPRSTIATPVDRRHIAPGIFVRTEYTSAKAWTQTHASSCPSSTAWSHGQARAWNWCCVSVAATMTDVSNATSIGARGQVVDSVFAIDSVIERRIGERTRVDEQSPALLHVRAQLLWPSAWGLLSADRARSPKHVPGIPVGAGRRDAPSIPPGKRHAVGA